jgi:anti-sigma factor RsiW
MVRAVSVVKRFTCDELAELVTAYLDDALAQPERAGVETHLGCCADCACYVGQIRSTVTALGALPADGPAALSPGTRERLLAAFRDRSRHPS